MASFTIEGPGGSITLEIDPLGATSGDTVTSPPPVEQQWVTGRIIAIHPIPGRRGSRKQDQGADDGVLTLIGVCYGDVASAIQGLAYASNSGAHYTLIYTPDAGPGITYPAMWFQRSSTGPRKGSAILRSFSMTFIEQNQPDSAA
jgi:hypothetical protein